MDGDDDIDCIGTQIVYENRWMTVRQDNVRFPGGKEGIYGVVDKPDFAAIVPLEEDGRIHLVRQYRYPVKGRFWEIPQGSYGTSGDIDPEFTAKTELAEETGLRAGCMTHIGHLFQGYGYASQGYHIFLATELRHGHPNREDTEADMITASFSLAEILQMINAGDVKDATTIAALGLLRFSGKL